MTESWETSEAEHLTGLADNWTDPPRAASGETAPILSVEGFEGPLDWLLEMARAQRIDLAQLSILALIEAFTAALEAALARRTVGRTSDLARWGDWLVMAAALTLLRSRLLLPANAPETRSARIEAEALRRQLVDRAQVSTAADWLERRPQLGRDVFARGAPGPAPARTADLTALLRACLVVLRLPESVEQYRPQPPSLWRVSDAVGRIGQLLGSVPDGSALGVFLPKIESETPDRELRCRAAIASTLVAGLELARAGALTLEQDEAWAPIQVRRSNGPE